jgi:hypothetical protein
MGFQPCFKEEKFKHPCKKGSETPHSLSYANIQTSLPAKIEGRIDCEENSRVEQSPEDITINETQVKRTILPY